jgi:hypothetical protein
LIFIIWWLCSLDSLKREHCISKYSFLNPSQPFYEMLFSMSPMKKQQVLPVILTLVILTIATTTLASISDINAQGTTSDTGQTDITAQDTTGDTGQTDINAQGTTSDTEQVKEYLNQAIQAIDDGNNTLALEQVGLASDSLQTMTGGTDAGEQDDDKGTSEEGAGEDADESGDVDTNDEEDSQSK